MGSWEGERVGIEWKSGVGGGESGDRQEEEWVGRGREWGQEWGRRGRVGIDRSGRGGGSGDRQEGEGGEWG